MKHTRWFIMIIIPVHDYWFMNNTVYGSAIVCVRKIEQKWLKIKENSKVLYCEKCIFMSVHTRIKKINN